MSDALYLVLLITLFLFRCLPGIFVACLGWLLTGWIRNKWPKVILRGLLVALAITPTAAGHAGFIPALWSFFDSGLWFAGLLPLLLVELGHAGHLRLNAELRKEATSFTLGRVLGI